MYLSMTIYVSKKKVGFQLMIFCYEYKDKHPFSGLKTDKHSMLYLRKILHLNLRSLAQASVTVSSRLNSFVY